ncbi:Sir2 family NAD-dependent protein deacetylase [Streptomyces montanus]|uniref:Sir2 family NAD-dependent protein deacetylase n=1 Tax=Streptomyces montanus TaxID=2580423 RepID=UPI001FE9FBA4|nr:Sir2 family NAD-dependent protein deacetylase [Streptomyces montanus]
MAKPLVAILSGAGISTDSGIPDYRGPNGLWRKDPEAEKLVTYEYYMGNPEIRRRSWQMRRKNRTLKAEPNAGHLAVAELERSGVPVRVITQNVDGLHQLAGMPALIPKNPWHVTPGHADLRGHSRPRRRQASMAPRARRRGRLTPYCCMDRLRAQAAPTRVSGCCCATAQRSACNRRTSSSHTSGTRQSPRTPSR